MRTNKEARSWCFEESSASNEAFNIFNAKKLITTDWRTAWRHTLLSLVLVIVGSVLGLVNNPMLTFAAMQVGFALYGNLNFCHNDEGAGFLAYITCLAFFPNVLKNMPTLSSVFIWIGIIIACVSFLFERNYKKAMNSYTQTTQREWANDEEEFEAWKRKYYNGYSRKTNTSSFESNAYTDNNQWQKQNSRQQEQTNHYQENTAQRATNKYADQARAMFANFGTTYAELKKTYRKLALKHHPDHGGEHDMFVAIVSEYEYLKATRFPNEK